MDVGVKIGSGEGGLAGQNLLQNEHVEAGYPGTAQEEIARSVYGKLACRF